MNGHIYIAYLREFIINQEDVYKIGKSENIKKRIDGYPKGTIFLFTSYVDDINLAETKVLSLLKIYTKHRSDIGKEYFQGNYGIIRGFILNVIDSINYQLPVRFIDKNAKKMMLNRLF